MPADMAEQMLGFFCGTPQAPRRIGLRRARFRRHLPEEKRKRVVEDEAIEQIRRMCDYAMTEGSKIRIMPDVHAGKGCTIGTTMTIKDKAVPNYFLVGSFLFIKSLDYI